MGTAFTRRGEQLLAEEVPLAQIAESAGTPCYVYSANAIRERVGRLREALEGVPHRLHYSLKANANGALLGVLRELGCGVDVVSGGELFRALRAGFTGADIVFGGVGKTRHELEEALDAHVKMINVESEAELRLLAELAAARGVVAPVGLRINPEVDVVTAHHYIATGEQGHKFGIGMRDAVAVSRAALGLPSIALIGLDMHIGSQLHTFDAYREGLERLVELARSMREWGAPIRFLDAGGGLPVPYDEEDEPDLAEYAEILREAQEALGEAEILIEHGRYVMAPSGTLVTRVLYRKSSGAKTYVICDAGMTELLRPSHYDAYHRIEPVGPAEGGQMVDVVGPVCETGDFLALNRELPDVEPGDLLAVHTVGAYGAVMASRYNARPLAAEVLVDGSRWAVVTARETYDDLVRHEVASPQWQEA